MMLRAPFRGCTVSPSLHIEDFRACMIFRPSAHWDKLAKLLNFLSSRKLTAVEVKQSCLLVMYGINYTPK